MFETVLAGHPSSGVGKSIAGPVAIALHGLIIGGVLVASAWRVGQIGEPNVPIIFSGPISPPAAPGIPAGGGKPHAAPGPSKKTPPIRTPIAVALTIPTALSPASIPTPDLGSDEMVTGSGDEGIPGGSPDGVGSNPGNARLSAPISATAPNVVPPRLLSQAQPDYPETARRIREQGLVVLQAVIGTDGAVEDVHLISSTSPLFDEPALRALRRWRYAPATMDRRAVRVYLTVTMRFTLH